MKTLVFAILILATLQSNGQSEYYQPRILSMGTWPIVSDSICKKRGHVWKDISPVYALYLGDKKTDPITFPIKQDSYIKDDKDTSWHITPLIWNYSCERCKQDSTSIKKEVVWHKP